MESAAVQNRIEHNGFHMASYSQKLRPQENLAGHGIPARSSGHLVTCQKHVPNMQCALGLLLMLKW
jgi:hypothetical protein